MRRNIIVIDNDSEILNLFKYAIDRSEFLVITSSFADEAILKARINEPCLVFFKLKMPRCDVVSMLKQLRKIQEDVFVYIMIEEENDKDIREIDGLIEKGFNCKACVKPFSDTVIQDMVDNVFMEDTVI